MYEVNLKMIKDQILGMIYTQDDNMDLDRFRFYEIHKTVSNLRPTVVRLDGIGFSKRTSQFKKEFPFYEEFDQVMIECCKFMVKKFKPDFALVGSDEISMIYKPRMNRNNINFVELPYGGKIDKINSSFASELSVEFTTRFIRGTFDSRVFNIPNDEVLNYLLWRQRSLYTNAVSQFADFYVGKKATFGINSSEKINRLKEKCVDFYKECPKTSLYGTFVIRNGNAYTMSLNRSGLSDQMINFIEYKM